MRRSTLLSLAVAGIATVITLAGAAMMVVNWPLPLTEAEWGFPGFQAVAGFVFTALGAAIATRRPENPVGWLLEAAGVMSTVQFLGHQLALYGLITAPGAIPAPSVGTWIEEWIWLPILLSAGVLTFLLFPTGRLLSSRWRVVAILGVVATAMGGLGGAFVPLTRVEGAVNPLAPGVPPPFAQPLQNLGASLLLVAMVLASWSLVIRFRASTGVERQQLKWLALGGIVVGSALAAYFVATFASGDITHPLGAVVAVTLLAVPATIWLAMLRHGLYEVDRLINRTIVYGVVSVVLAVMYAGSVLLLQPVLRPLTGTNSVAVAASTLLVATIFQPVRWRVQRAVDRRFFRSRYDAGATLERFGARLRDEVDFTAISETLVREIRTAVQPSTVSVWTRRR